MSQNQLPSGIGLTAISIATERRIETERPDRMFRDDLAGAFCAAAMKASGPAGITGFTGLSLGDFVPMLRGYMALRTRLFDDLLLDACAAGCRQVVILAAGLDARAFRLAWPEGVRLFELDVPEVLAFKRGVLDEAAATPSCERHEVAVDLREDWPSALKAQRFDASAPTVWLVEGLLLYLTEEDNNRIFEAISALSAPGSRLGFEHGSPTMLNSPAIARSREETLGKVGVTWLSAVADPVAWLARHGWSAEHLDAATLSTTYGRAVPPVLDPAQGEARLWILGGKR